MILLAFMSYMDAKFLQVRLRYAVAFPQLLDPVVQHDSSYLFALRLLQCFSQIDYSDVLLLSDSKLSLS